MYKFRKVHLILIIFILSTARTHSMDAVEQRKPRRLPVETWTEVLSWPTQQELVQSVSLVTRMFYAIARPRLEEHNARLVPELEFTRKRPNRPGSAAQLMISRQGTRPVAGSRRRTEKIISFQKVPIASTAPPPNIIGFEQIIIRHLDDKVLNFLRLIIHLLNGIPMTIHGAYRGWATATAENLRSRHLDVCRLAQINMFFEIFEGHVALFECYRKAFVHLSTAPQHAASFANFMEPIKYLQAQWWPAYSGIFSGSSRHDDSNATELQFVPLLAAWLNSPAGARWQPKLIFDQIFEVIQLVNMVREQFLASTVPAPFVLNFFALPEMPTPFRIENNASGEELIVGEHYHKGENYFLLRRFHIGDDTTWRAMIEQQDQLLMRNKIGAMGYVQLHLDEI